MKCNVHHQYGTAFLVKMKSQDDLSDCLFRIIHDNKHRQVRFFVLTSPYQKYAFYPFSQKNILPACEVEELRKESHDSFLLHCRRISLKKDFYGFILHVLSVHNQLIVITMMPQMFSKNSMVVNAPNGKSKEDAQLFIFPYLKK